MNERIRELAEQARITISGYADDNSGYYEPSGSSPEELEKFAELMIEQFDLILANEYLDCVGENDKKSQFRIDRLRERVKEYFGVDE
jgi:hypothetical protein